MREIIPKTALLLSLRSLYPFVTSGIIQWWYLLHRAGQAFSKVFKIEGSYRTECDVLWWKHFHHFHYFKSISTSDISAFIFISIASLFTSSEIIQGIALKQDFPDPAVNYYEPVATRYKSFSITHIHDETPSRYTSRIIQGSSGNHSFGTWLGIHFSLTSGKGTTLFRPRRGNYDRRNYIRLVRRRGGAGGRGGEKKSGGRARWSF